MGRDLLDSSGTVSLNARLANMIVQPTMHVVKVTTRAAEHQKIRKLADGNDGMMVQVDMVMVMVMTMIMMMDMMMMVLLLLLLLMTLWG